MPENRISIAEDFHWPTPAEVIEALKKVPEHMKILCCCYDGGPPIAITWNDGDETALIIG